MMNRAVKGLIANFLLHFSETDCCARLIGLLRRPGRPHLRCSPERSDTVEIMAGPETRVIAWVTLSVVRTEPQSHNGVQVHATDQNTLRRP